MSDRRFATDNRDQEEAADESYFARLASARHLQLTTFERDGAPVSAPVPAVVDDDRAYFGAWSRSGSPARLRHIDAVQVRPCSARGFCTYGPALDALARLLPAGEASPVAAKLARKHPVRRRFLIPLLRRTRRWQMVHYELLADDAAGDDDECPEGLQAPDQLGDQSGRYAAHGDQGLTRCQIALTHVTDHRPASIAGIWSVPVHR